MYIKTDNPDLQQFKCPEMDGIAAFSSNNIARVSESDGQVLIQIDGFSEHKPNNDE